MRRSNLSWAARMACSLLTVIAALGSATAQTGDNLFDISILQEVRITIDPAKWQEFKERYTEDSYYPADFSWNGINIKNVGIRHRGTGSRSGVKPYIGIDFGQYVKGQQFLGLSALRMKNSLNDPSFLRERLGMLAMRHMGIPGPREAYARLYINDQYFGLFILIEEIDQAFLRRSFGDDTGYLFNYQWVQDYNFEYLGSVPLLYSPIMFDPKTRKSDPDVATLVEMIRAINESPDDAFIARVSEYIDLKKFLSYVAVENFIGEWDGILGHMGMNNFYLYRFSGSKQFHFIAWDKDNTFPDPEFPIWNKTERNVLTSRALQYPELRDVYLGTLRMAALELGASDGWLDRELNRAYSQIRFAALEDTSKYFTNDDFEFGVGMVRQFVQARADFVLSQTGIIPLPAISANGEVNAATLSEQPVAPGSIVSIFGSHLAESEMEATEIPLPTSMGETIVRINGSAAPLFYVSPTQINFQVPWELDGASTSLLTVAVDKEESAPVELRLRPIDPGLFTTSAKSRQGAVIIASTGELAAPVSTGLHARPAHRGEAISIYCTGLGPVTNQPASGDEPFIGSLSEVSTVPQVNIGGTPVAVTFAGLAPKTVGLYQINVSVPTNVPAGTSVPVVILMSGVSSNVAIMSID